MSKLGFGNFVHTDVNKVMTLYNSTLFYSRSIRYKSSLIYKCMICSFVIPVFFSIGMVV